MPRLDTEVMVSVIDAGVEEVCQLTGIGVDTGKVQPFVTIAKMAGEGEVRFVVAPVMLLRHDVLHVKCDEIMTLMDATILAVVPRSIVHA